MEQAIVTRAVPEILGLSIASPRELAAGLLLPDHFLAVRVKGVVNDPFRSIECVIVLVSEMAEAFCDRFQAGPFRLLVKRVVRISAVDDPSQQYERSVADKRVFLENCLKRAL